jgi:hypothetical protein
MENKKAFERPEVGAFYMVPDPKTNKYTILSAFDTPGEDSAHFFLWDEVKKVLQARFKNADMDYINDTYQGIPRGRVSERSSKDWLVLHGNDFPLEEYKADILSEYKLQDAESLGKVLWVVENHEKMNQREKESVEKTLGIVITPKGFKKGK